MTSTRCSQIAHARPNPSYVEVPRPSSSIIIRDLSEAPFKMDAVSSISCIKVDTPRSWQSPAPTRAKIQSLTLTLARSHGTKEPTCAIKTFTPTCLIKVDFPPMFGPVMI
uniref:MUS1 n=1 Tax=Arundo donax TaxID=35708 RepID=A0A0A9FCA3_ARUDO